MTVSVDDVFRVALEWSMPELTKAFNVLGFRCSSGSCTDGELLTALDALFVTALAYIAGNTYSTSDVEEGRVSKMEWVAGAWEVAQVLGVITPTFTPTDGTDMLPHAVAGVITLPTAHPRRRGRIFLPAMTEAQQDKSILESGAVTAFTNFANAITAVMTPGSANVSYAVLGSDGVARHATTYVVNSLVGSQRRRKPGIGV